MEQFHQPQINSIYTSYQDLPNYPQGTDLQQVILMINQNFMTKCQWKTHFDAIDNLRVFNKYYPSEINGIFQTYGIQIQECLENPNTSIQKNAILLVKEMFMNGQITRVSDDIIRQILPIILQKASSEKKIIKIEVQQTLEQFSQNCLYDISMITIAEQCFSKIKEVQELSIQLFAQNLQLIGLNIQKLQSHTLQVIMQAVSKLLNGTPILKTYGKQIAFFILNLGKQLQ